MNLVTIDPVLPCGTCGGLKAWLRLALATMVATCGECLKAEREYFAEQYKARNHLRHFTIGSEGG